MVELLYEQELQSSFSRSVLDSSLSPSSSNSRFYSSKSSLATIDVLDESYLESLPSYHLDGSFGIDMIRVSLIVDPNSVVHASFLSNVYGTEGNKTNGRVRLPGQPNIYLFWPDTGKQIMSIRFNPSNFSRLDGYEICPPPLLSTYVEKVIRAVLAMGDPQARPIFMENEPWGVIGPWPSNWTESIGISELHLARDLTIADARFDLEQMRCMKPQRMGAVKLILGPTDLVETVTHTSGKGTSRHQIYDKHKERKKALASKKQGKAVSKPIPKGTFRYEVQMPRLALRKKHINTLDLLTPDRIQKMALNYWSDSNYHRPLIWEGQVATDLAPSLTDTEIAQVLQFIRNQSLGVNMSYTPKEVKQIEKAIKKFGISSKSPLSQQGKPYGHLDFEVGGLVPLP